MTLCVSMTWMCIIHISYRQLLEMTCKVSNVLKDYGISRGDRVIIYLPAMPLAVASMLACTRMGAVHWYNLPAKLQIKNDIQ